MMPKSVHDKNIKFQICLFDLYQHFVTPNFQLLLFTTEFSRISTVHIYTYNILNTQVPIFI